MGYCTQHEKVLLTPSSLTCGRHFHKDLPAARAASLRANHEQHFSPSAIFDLWEKRRSVNSGRVSDAKSEKDTLSRDPVGALAINYAQPGLPKIATLAGLNQTTGARAEMALLSLSAKALLRWVKSDGIKAFDAALSEKRYQKLSSELRPELD